MTLKVLFSSSGLRGTYGGSAFSEATLSSRLQSLGEVTLMCRQDKLDEAFARRYGIKRFATYRTLDPFFAWLFPSHRLNALFKAHDVFHMNGHWKWESFFVTRLALRHRVPYVLHPRGMLLVGHRKVLIKRIFNLLIGNSIVKDAAKLIALSRFEVLRQFKGYPIEKDRIVVIPNGIQPPEGSDSPLVNTAEPYFLYLGRLERRKNLIFLVDAFHRYLKWGGDAHLICVGPVERGYDVEVEARIRALGLSDRISLRPAVFEGEKWNYIKKARAVIYPSLQEPFGRVPFEALCVGTVPIVPEASGSAEYLKPFLPQCIYQTSNLDSLSSALEAVSRAKRGGGVDSARAWVRSELAPDHIAQKVYFLYEALVGRTASAETSAAGNPR